MGLLYGRAGRLTAKNGGFWPRRADDEENDRESAGEDDRESSGED